MRAFGARNVPLALMLLGVVINVTADEHLRALRTKKDGGGEGRRRERRDEPRHEKWRTRDARGRTLRSMRLPHYLGELLEWCGFAAMTGTASACAFAFWTFANLFPRATAYREWYRERFGGATAVSRLPPRRAMIPFIASS